MFVVSYSLLISVLLLKSSYSTELASLMKFTGHSLYLPVVWLYYKLYRVHSNFLDMDNWINLSQVSDGYRNKVMTTSKNLL